MMIRYAADSSPLASDIGAAMPEDAIPALGFRHHRLSMQQSETGTGFICLPFWAVTSGSNQISELASHSLVATGLRSDHCFVQRPQADFGTIVFFATYDRKRCALGPLGARIGGSKVEYLEDRS